MLVLVATPVFATVATAVLTAAEGANAAANEVLGYARPVCIGLVVAAVVAVAVWRLVTAPARRREREAVAAFRADQRAAERRHLRPAFDPAAFVREAIPMPAATALPAAPLHVTSHTRDGAAVRAHTRRSA